MALRPFIPRAGEVLFTGPSGFGNAKLYGFLVKADHTSVHELLARYIGRPSEELGLHIDVAATPLDYVLFLFVDSERHQRALHRGPGSEGRQGEQLFAVVVLGERQGPDPGLVLFAPYVYASETPGWRAERETYGYPQQYGRVHIEEGNEGGPDLLSVISRVIVRFDESATAEERQFLRITKKKRSKGSDPFRPPAGGTLAEWLVAAVGPTTFKRRRNRSTSVVERPRLRATAADASFFARCPRGLRSGTPSPIGRRQLAGAPFDLGTALSESLPMLFLKQFRDIVQPGRACYQAIVEAKLTVTGKVGAIYLDDYDLALDEVDSAPICRELGIDSKAMNVDFAFRLDLEEMFIDKASVISNPYWNPAAEVSLADETSRLPRYVDRGGEAVWRQPSLLSGARIYGFGVPVPAERQDDLLKRCVNDVADKSDGTYGPSARRFQLSALPDADTVMLLFVEYKRITSGNDDDRRLGGTSYREFLAMQLALSSDDHFPELNWFIPFIYLDTDAPRLSGREIYGYPKQFGAILPFEQYPGADGDLDPAKTLGLEATVVGKKSEKRATRGSIIRVHGPVPGPPAITSHYLNAEDMFRDVLKNLSHAQVEPVLRHLNRGRRGVRQVDRGTRVENALVFSNIGNVFLKQFRDCADPSTACYQAVCKTDTVPGVFHGGGSLDPSGYRITIRNLASDPLLGYLTGDQTTASKKTITPTFAYWVDLDFELTHGRVIANPYETPYVPDLSAVASRLKTEGIRRAVRPSAQAELLDLYPSVKKLFAEEQ